MRHDNWSVERAETTRRASRWVLGVTSILWVVNLFTNDRMMFGADALWVRGPMIGACLGGLLWQLRWRPTAPRPRARLELILLLIWLSQVAWLLPHLARLPPEIIYPFVGSLTVGSVVVALASAFSPLATAIFALSVWGVGLAALFIGGIGPADHPIHLLIIGVLIAAARRRDQLAMRAFEAQRERDAARAALEAQVAVRSDLFLSLSHDVRIPLSLIRAEAEELTRRPLEPHELTALGRIIQRSDALAGFADQALALARLELEQTVSRPAAVQLSTMAREIATLHGCDSGVEVAIVGDEAASAWIDPDHARSIVTNLVSNALRHATRTRSEGGPRVDIGVHRDGDRVLLDVSNNGPPIDESVRARLFQRFAAMRDGAGLGAGLGLALSRELARLAGGELELVESSDQTLFRASLPAATPSPARASEHVIAAHPDAASLLVVEDEHQLAALVAKRLGERHNVRVAHDIETALTELEDHPPDLIITDLFLPDGRGETLIDLARSRSELAAIPILVVSAVADQSLREGTLRDGVDDHLVKPFSMAELVARVEGALARARRARERLTAQRREVVGELHDGVASALGRALISIQRLAAGPAERQDLERVSALIQGALSECRALLDHLTDRAVEPVELAADIRRELAELCEQHDLSLAWRLDVRSNKARVSAPAAHTLRRAAMEAVTNTVRHARARAVNASLTFAADSIRLSVEDDGLGFARAPEGLGLNALRHRVETLGGAVVLGRSDESDGARVEVAIPSRLLAAPA